MAINSKVAIEVEIKNIKKIADLKQELKELRKAQKDQEKESKSGRFQSKKNAEAYKKRAQAIKQNSKELRELNKNMAGTTSATKKATQSQNSMAKQFIKGAAAIGVIVGAFRTVSRAISSVVSTFTEFEFVMAKVNAVSGATESEFEGLTKTAEELGRSTFFTAAQVGELMLNFSKLGFTAQEIQKAVEPTLALATATGSDLARSATVAGAAVRGFGLDASETTRVVDVMAVSFASSAMDIEKWQTSMTKVAPIAKSAGFSIEDTAAMMSKLTDAGIEASIAGTSLRNILLKMQDPTSELSMSFGSTIHSLDDLVPAMEKFVLEGGSMADVMEVVDIRQAAAFETLLMSADGLIDFRNELNNATGEGYRMAQMVGDTLQGSFLRLKSAAQGMSIALMDNFGDALKESINKLANFLNRLAENEEGIKKTIKQVKLLVKGLLALVVGLKPARLLMKLFAADVAATGVAMTVTKGFAIALSAAMRGLKVAIASTGVGLLIIALGELAARFMFAASEEEKLAAITDEHGRAIQGIIDKEKTLNKIKKESENVDAKKFTIIEGLIDKYADENTTLKEQEKILKKLERINGDFFGGMRTGITTVNDLKDASAEYKKELVEIARVKATTESLAEVDIELVTIKSELEHAFSALEDANELNDLIKEFKNENRTDILGMGLLVLADDVMNAFNGGMQGEARDDISAAIDKVNVLKQELKEAQDLRKILKKNLDGIDLEKMLGLDLGGGGSGGNGGTTGQDAIDWATKLQAKLNDIKAKQDSGEYGVGEAAIKIIEAQQSINRQEYATLKESDRNGKRGVALQGKYLDDKLKLTKLKLGETMKVYQSDYADEITDLQQMLIKKEITEAEFNERSLEARKWFLNAEYEEMIDAIGDRKMLTKEEAVAIEENRKSYNAVELNLIKTQTSEKERLLKQEFEKQVLELENERATTMMSDAVFKTNMLILEAQYLNKKKDLYAGNALELIDINNSILKNTIKVNQTQKEMLNEQVSALGGVGSAMSTLAGENERFNAIKEAGNKISAIANTIQAITTLQTNLQTIAEGKLAIANLITAKSEVAKGAASQTKIPFPFNIIAVIGTLALLGKIMGVFEKGGIVDEFGKGGVIKKFADGGMVKGKSHAQGGEKFAVGGRVVELEGGEAVINKRSTSMYRSQLSAMNEAGGGVKFADGGLLNSPQFANQQFSSGMGNKGGMQKVYVVESDITSSQRTVNVLESQATL
tara:strand:+ start:13363 stop:17046 length:3684 start_codon:yes stop_codon:yes gene_type:complete